MEDLHNMMEVVMTQMKKLDKLDIIEEKLQSLENERRKRLFKFCTRLSRGIKERWHRTQRVC
jgi:hypothetical protein